MQYTLCVCLQLKSSMVLYDLCLTAASSLQSIYTTEYGMTHKFPIVYCIVKDVDYEYADELV